MRLRSAASVAVGLVWAMSRQDPAQTRQAPPIFRAGVDVVQLEVSVLDGDRHPVHGLTKADLQVFEDGKRQDIIELDEIVRDDDPTPPVWARAVATDIATNDLIDRRLIAVVMDDLHCCGTPDDRSVSDRWAIMNETATARRIVDELGPRDLATVVLTHDLMPVERFTNDRDALYAVIARFAPISEAVCAPAPPIPNLARELTTLLAMSPEPVKALVVFESMPFVPRPPNFIPTCSPRSYVIPDTGRRVYPTPRSQAGPGRDPDPLSLPPVPTYHLNVSGLTVPGGFRMSGPNPSGGRDYRATNDLASAVDDVLAENDTYYLLGFRTSRPTADGAYRRLDIKVPGHGNYTVRSRVGYFRPKPAPKPGSRADRDPELPRPPAVVSNLLPSADVTLQAAVAAFAVPDRATVALVIVVDLAHAIAQDTPTGTEELDLRAVAYVSDDPKYDVVTKTTIAVPAGSSRVTALVPARVDVAPERYELWLTAHDPRTSLIGGVFYDIDVPDFAAHAVMLSGVVLGADPAAGTTVPAAIAGLVPIVPMTSRMFGQGQSVTAFFQIYQGLSTPLAPVALKIRVLDDRGAAAFSQDDTLGVDRFSAHRAADYRLRLPLDKLATGRYLLSIEAQLGDRISPKRDVPFRVR